MIRLSVRLGCAALGLLLTVGVLFPQAQVCAHETIYTVTGTIQAIDGKVITLEGGNKLQPFHEVDIPAWMSVGEKVKFSYYVRSRGNCYLEIVPPDGELTVKEKLEFLQMQSN